MSNTTIVGQRIDDNATPRAYKHPSAASAWIDDGSPIDAGTLHFFENDLNHYVAESCRHLVFEPAFGLLKYTSMHGYDGYLDTPHVPSPSLVASQLSNISWDRRTANCYGPFAGVEDMYLDSGSSSLVGRMLRFVRFKIDVNVVNELSVYCAITATNSIPLFGDPFKVVDPGMAAGRTTVTVTLPLATTYAFGSNAGWRCRKSGAYAAVTASVKPYWCWVGYYGSNADAVIGISIFETRTFV